jgi:hypothetical protein
MPKTKQKKLLRPVRAKKSSNRKKKCDKKKSFLHCSENGMDCLFAVNSKIFRFNCIK